MKRSIIPALILFASMSPGLIAQDAPDASSPREESSSPSETEEANASAATAKFLASLNFQSGPQTILNGSVTLNLPDGFTFLSASDAKKVLNGLWGNPPEATEDALGLIVPPKVSLTDEDSWATVVSYEDSGYVSDEDAAKTDYDDLLKSMKENSAASNKARKAKGYPTLELVGWALPPVYDKDLKVLYWAQELHSGRETNTLNYDVRVLGRKGVLSLNCVAGMDQLSEVKGHAPEIAGIAQFNTGHRYADFNPSSDKKAAYGIAGLIAGTAIAAKTGFFKGILVALLAAKKFLVVAVLALVGFVKRLFGRKDD